MVNKRADIKKTQSTRVTNSLSKALTLESGAIIGSNDDLLNEIFLRLPVTSICRFKSVSKHWQSLLSHRRFTLTYDKVLISPGLFVRDLYIPFDFESQTPPPFRSLNFIPDRCGIRFVQSCNGLLLCCSHRGKEHTRKYYVFNPTTKQFVVIPPIIGGSDDGTIIRFMGLAFSRDDFIHYKVVCFLNEHSFRNAHYHTKSFKIQIYSSDTRKWRVSKESFLSSCGKYSSNGVYWNGAMHWIPNSSHVVYFKLDTEQVQKMSLPVRASSSFGAWTLYFGESRGHLHLMQAVGYEKPLYLNVYEMLNDYSDWFIRYRVELDELSVAYPDLLRSIRDPLYQFEVFDVVRGDEEEERAFMVVRIGNNIIRYDVVNKSFQKIATLPNLFRHVYEYFI